MQCSENLSKKGKEKTKCAPFSLVPGPLRSIQVHSVTMEQIPVSELESGICLPSLSFRVTGS